MPVRALGAPQTTCTGSAPPVSTRQTRSRSALGCCLASITWGHGEGGERLGLVLDALDLEPDAGQRFGYGLDGRGGVEMILQPGQGELHERPSLLVIAWDIGAGAAFSSSSPSVLIFIALPRQLTSPATKA